MTKEMKRLIIYGIIRFLSMCNSGLVVEAFSGVKTTRSTYSEGFKWENQSNRLLRRNYHKKRLLSLFSEENPDGYDNKVEVGSDKYYEGFFTRSLNEEPESRVTGDAILGPTIKFVSGATAILTVLFLSFMKSNGLIWWIVKKRESAKLKICMGRLLMFFILSWRKV